MANFNMAAVKAITDRFKSNPRFGFIFRKLNLYHIKKLCWTIFRTVIIVGISFMIFWPVMWILHFTFMDSRDLADSTVIFVPKHFTLANITKVFNAMDYFNPFMGSIKLSLSTSILQVISCTLIAYGFARFKFRGRNIFFALVILTLLIPPQTIMISTFLHYRFMDFFGIIQALRGRSGILDTYWPFILQAASGLGIKNGLYILILRQFFRGMPKEIEEAAWADGAGVFRTFYQVMLPNAVPAITTVFLFSFVWQWNDTYFVSLYLENIKVLSKILLSFTSTIEAAMGPQDPWYMTILYNAGQLLVIAPMIILYVFAQRYFVESVERAGIVG